MDEKDLAQNEEFDLDSILNEFHDPSADMTEDGAADLPEDDMSDLAALLGDLGPSEAPEEPVCTFSPEPAAEEAPEEDLQEEDGLDFQPMPEETPEVDLSGLDLTGAEPAEEGEAPEEDPFGEPSPDPDLSPEGEEVPQGEEVPEGDPEALQEEDLQEEEPAGEEESSDEETDAPDAEEEEAPLQPPLVYDPRASLRELKRKLVAGPEKRYYALSELGVGRLQLAILVNLALVGICAFSAVLFAMGRIPADRMRLLIFTQVLAVLVSGLLGLNQMLDGLAELLKGRFTVNTMLSMTFLACLADGFFSLRDMRVPSGCAFCLEMTLALCARAQRLNTEMGQMDTLRKAVHLHGIVKVPDYYQGQPGFLRQEAELEDFWNNYQKSSGPQKLQSVYAFISFLVCIAIAALGGMLHGISLAVQVLAASMLVAVPASFFVALTRPAAIMERRLHMVGAVFCGWSGVRSLCSKAAFPLSGSDLFPKGALKLSGIKFYSERDPDMIVSYTASLVQEAGSGLIPIFTQLMNSRGVVANPVYNFTRYENGGIGGEVCGEPVLVGSLSFLQSMGVEIPQCSMVNQAVYAAIDGQLAAVVAISYAKMRSAAAGIVTLCGYRQLTPIFTGEDFVLTEGFIRSKFEVKTRRLLFPNAQDRAVLNAKAPEEPLPSLAISTRPDLISFAYAVTGARALRTSCHAGMILHLLGGIVGLLTMAALAITGSTNLLTPINVLLYQIVWLVPGFLITEWARHV